MVKRGSLGSLGITSLAMGVILLVMLVLILFSSPATRADTGENISVTVSVGNEAPTVGAITCSPSSLTPVAGENTSVSCWATISDANGYQDVNQSSLNMTFYLDSVGLNQPDDLNNHYSNGTSSHRATDCTWGTGSGTDILVNCSFHTTYYITPYNTAAAQHSNWTVNLTIKDNADAMGSNILQDYLVNAILGIDVLNATMDFGSLSLGAGANSSVEVQNTGNQAMDIKLMETIQTGDPLPGNITCTVGNITTDLDTSGLRYNKTSTADWANQLKLTATSTIYAEWDQPYYDATGITHGSEVDLLYWQLILPSSGIGGSCIGTIEFIAT